jgi:superfamily I DNA and RNA helicase
MGFPPRPSENIPTYEKGLAASVSEVVKAVDQGHIPTEQYDAVLIEEAHDFEPQWLALAAKMVSMRARERGLWADDQRGLFLAASCSRVAQPLRVR